MRIKFSGTLLRFVGYKREIVVEEELTIAQALKKIVSQYPQLEHPMLDSEGGIRELHQIYLNDKRLEHSQLETIPDNNDVVRIVTAVAGG